MRSKPSEPLSNPQHEAFAQEVASGRNVTHSYMKVYGTENLRTAAANGSRLLRQKTVAARIRAIQKAGATDVALDLRAIHHFLARVIGTPAGEVTPTSDLCSRVKHTRDGSTDVWMPDKLACLRFIARLQGFLDPKHLAGLAVKAAEIAAPPVTEVRVLTEERRAVLIKNKRDATLRRLERQEEERELREQVRAQKKKYAENGRVIDETPHQENSSTPAPASSQPAPPEPKPDVWIGPSGRYPYFGMNFRKPPQPQPTPPTGQAPTPTPEPNPTRHGEAERSRQPETRNQKPEPSPKIGTQHLPMPPRVTPNDSPKNVSNYHHPAGTTSADAPAPQSSQPTAATAEEPIPEPTTLSDSERGAQSPARSPEPNPKPETRNPKPPILNAWESQNPTPEQRARINREAAIRLRLTGDSSACDALLVI